MSMWPQEPLHHLASPQVLRPEAQAGHCGTHATARLLNGGTLRTGVHMFPNTKLGWLVGEILWAHGWCRPSLGISVLQILSDSLLGWDLG